jgi:hypothetical protein
VVDWMKVRIALETLGQQPVNGLRHPAVLPPGYRFLVAPGHDDVWFDEELPAVS